MKKMRIKDILRYKSGKMEVFGHKYTFYIDWLFDRYIKGRSIKNELNKWDSPAKIIILGDITIKYPQFFKIKPEDYFNDVLSEMLYDMYIQMNPQYLGNVKVYADESMNFRKAFMRTTYTDELKNKFFVLGGIIVPKGVNLAKIKKLLKAPTNMKEFKFKYFANNKKMPELLKSPRITTILNFMLDNNIYVHINILNYWYWSLSDIIDSLILNDERLFVYQRELKSNLYDVLNKNYEDAYNLLIKYDYPSIPRGKEKDFIIELVKIYQCTLYRHFKPGDRGYSSKKFLLNFLNRSKNVGELPFIQDNPPKTLLDTLAYSYNQTSVAFIHQSITFDNEEKIRNDLKNINKTYLSKMNCSFKDSKNSLGIQLSDFVSGFTSRLLEFVMSYEDNPTPSFIDAPKTNDNELLNLYLFKKLLDKSIKFYRLSSIRIMSMYDEIIFNNFLNMFSKMYEIGQKI